MRTAFKKSFLKEIKKLNDAKLKTAIINCIEQIELAEAISEIKNLKKLTGYNFYYRIRIGDYRIGLKIETDLVYFVIFEHRKDIYQSFP